MKIKFRVNLGSVDAAGLKLDWSECKQGSELDVSKATGELLCERGIAEPVTETVKGVAKQPSITAPGK